MRDTTKLTLQDQKRYENLRERCLGRAEIIINPPYIEAPTGHYGKTFRPVFLYRRVVNRSEAVEFRFEPRPELGLSVIARLISPEYTLGTLQDRLSQGYPRIVFWRDLNCVLAEILSIERELLAKVIRLTDKILEAGQKENKHTRKLAHILR